MKYNSNIVLEKLWFIYFLILNRFEFSLDFELLTILETWKTKTMYMRFQPLFCTTGVT